MNNTDIVRAWKDADFRASLELDDLDHLPENPAGVVELSDQDLYSVAGGTSLPCMITVITYLVCTVATTCSGCGS